MARVFGGFGTSTGPSVEATDYYQGFKRSFEEISNADGTRAQQLSHFADAFERVRNDYVHKVDDKKMLEIAAKALRAAGEGGKKISPEAAIENALDAIMATLDSHSVYLTPVEYRETQVVTTGQFGGLGIEINMEDGLIHVIAPIADTPAERAGLKSGDLITHVDGDPIKGMNIMQAVRRLRGAPDTDVRLGIRRAGKDDFSVVLTRAIIHIQPVKSAREGDIGILRVTHFIQSSDRELKKAVLDLRKKIGRRLKGIVVDLRNNPGGLLRQSVAVSDAFLQGGTVVSIKDRDGNSRDFDATRGDITGGLPIVVLINRGSASASEIVAGALQDHRRATVMGNPSFGKGSVQTISPLDWGGAIKLTTALYYLPSGRTIQGSGVTPDIQVKNKDEAARRQEADLPNAFPNPGEGKPAPVRKRGPELQEESCPAAGPKGEDKLLGCAVMFLNAGSQAKFLALIGQRKSL
ncbi:MAG: S41 family peptidase [Rhodospirillales bacterium]|nr:S41 family peptidase [Rhodospirillales bacterium]